MNKHIVLTVLFFLKKKKRLYIIVVKTAQALRSDAYVWVLTLQLISYAK